MQLNYEEASQLCLVQLKVYRQARQDKKHWDYWLFQNIRDEISEVLALFIEESARLRMVAEVAENTRKQFVHERKLYYRDKLGTTRGSAGLAETKAEIDAASVYQEEAVAKFEYQKARALMERMGDLCNSISGRTKGLLNDKES